MAQESTADIFLQKITGEIQARNSSAMSLSEYNKKMAYLLAVEAGSSPMGPKQYYLERWYCLGTNVSGERTLMRTKTNEDGNFLYIVPNELMYETILREHVALGHLGQTNMKKHMKKMFYNVTQNMIRIFLEMCEDEKCQKNRNRGAATKNANSMLVDFIDKRAESDGEFYYILTALDHKTKFLHLRPIKDMDGKLISEVLNDIFLTTSGAPKILQFINGKAFNHKSVHQLEQQWDGLTIKTGESVENFNADVSKHLMSWQTDNGLRASDWVSVLKHVQFKMNSTIHSVTKVSPIEALFGKPATVGLTLSSLSSANIKVEHEDQFMDSDTSSQSEQLHNLQNSEVDQIIKCEEPIMIDDDATVIQDCTKKRKIDNDGQDMMINKKIKLSILAQPPLNVCDNVQIPVPKIEPGIPFTWTSTVVTEVSKHGKYKLGYNIPDKYNFLALADLSNNELSLQQSIKEEAI